MLPSPQLLQAVLLAGSWSCQWPEICFWSYIPGGAAFRSQASVDFAAGHLCTGWEDLLSPELFLLHVWLRVCVCFFFFLNLCFPPLKCWDLGGVSFRKPSLANVHNHSLLLLLTPLPTRPSSWHLLTLCQARPWEKSLLAKPIDGEHAFKW